MVIVKKEEVKQIPYLHVVKQQLENTPLPVVIFMHGFESVKERNLQYAYMLAEKGLRVVMPDALFHGERGETANRKLQFWNIIITAIHDLQVIKEELMRRDLIKDERIGLAGTSMGGIITLGAMVRYQWIKAAVSLMGSPAYVDFAQKQLETLRHNQIPIPHTEQQIENIFLTLQEYDATLHIQKWNYCPILFWHGKQDEVVPYQPAYQFYTFLKPEYKERDIPISFILDEKAGHAVPNQGVIATLDWLVEYV